MTWTDRTPEPVHIAECPCPGTPHPDGDTVFLAPLLSMAGGMAAQVAMSEGSTDLIALQEMLARVYLTHGVVGWTFVDDQGQPIPVSYANAMLLLPYGKGGRLVADKADELYAQDLLAPFQEQIERARRSLAGQTSPKRATSRRQTSTKPPR